MFLSVEGAKGLSGFKEFMNDEHLARIEREASSVTELIIPVKTLEDILVENGFDCELDLLSLDCEVGAS